MPAQGLTSTTGPEPTQGIRRPARYAEISGAELCEDYAGSRPGRWRDTSLAGPA
jgi:hypothetical protein